MPPNRTGAAAELFAGTLPVHAARDRFHAIAVAATGHRAFGPRHLCSTVRWSL